MFNEKKFAHIFAAAFYGVLTIAALIMLIIGSANSEWANRSDVNFMAFFCSACLFVVPGFYYLEREIISEDTLSARILVRIIRFALFVILTFLVAGMSWQTEERGTNATNAFLVYTFTSGALLSAVVESFLYSLLYTADQEGNSKNLIFIFIYASPFICTGIGAALAVIGGANSLAIILCVYIASIFMTMLAADCTINTSVSGGNKLTSFISTIMVSFGFFAKLIAAVLLAIFLTITVCTSGIEGVILVFTPWIAIGYTAAALIMSKILSSVKFRDFDPQSFTGFCIFCLALLISTIATMILFAFIWWIGLILLLVTLLGTFIYIYVNSPVDDKKEKEDAEDRHARAYVDRTTGNNIAKTCEVIISKRARVCRDFYVTSSTSGDTLILEIHMTAPSDLNKDKLGWFNADCQDCISWVKNDVLNRLSECNCTKVEFEVIPHQ